MKILRIEPQEQQSKVFTLQLEFNQATGVLSGTVGTATHTDGDLIMDINIDLNKWIGKLVEVRLGMTEKGYEISVYDAMKNYSIGNGMPGVAENRYGLMHRLFRIFVHEEINESIIQIHKGHGPISGFEDIVEDGNISLRMYNLVRRDEKCAKVVRLARLKSDMLGIVDQRDSVSYLEAQVDILTRLVLALHKNSDDPLIDILKKADENSVLDIKKTSALIEEFTEKKAWVRTVQKDYYEAKAAEETAS